MRARSVLALAAAPAFVFAACRAARHRRRRRRAGAAGRVGPAASAPRAGAGVGSARRSRRRSGSSSSGRRRPSSRGYFAAEEQGYYEAEDLNVTIVAGGADVIPQAVGSAADGPEFTITWVPKVLEAREAPASDLVDIAQVFQRSGTLSVSWKDSNITDPADFEGKKVGVWDFGNEFEVTAGALPAA